MGGVKLFLALCAACALAACAVTPPTAVMSKYPLTPPKSAAQVMLNELPPPTAPIAVAVYGFSDQTGQFKPSTTQNLSRAVSQGGATMLARSLQEAGNRKWFTIVEREQLKDVLNERQLIRDMRAQYLGERGVNPQALPALLFAGVLLEGGVIGYDSNTVTGGVGATILGLGATGKYQQDTVTVMLRAVSVKTGEVLTTVTASKTITSYAVDANVFRYVGQTSLLETENGFTTNEPGMLALQQAIDKAVYGLIMEGADPKLDLWRFADLNAAWPAMWRYQQERDGVLTPEQAAAVQARAKAGAKAAQLKPVPVPQAPPAPPPPPAAALATPRNQASATPAAGGKPATGAPASSGGGGIDDMVRMAASPNGERLAQSNSPARAPSAGEEPAGQTAKTIGGGSPH